MMPAERDAMSGEGRALPHRGFNALQPCRISMAHKSTLRRGTKVLMRFMLICFMQHRTPCGWRSVAKSTGLSIL